MAFWQKTRHSGKITGFTAFDDNHGFCGFRDYLLSLIISACIIGTGNMDIRFEIISDNRKRDPNPNPDCSCRAVQNPYC